MEVWNQFAAQVEKLLGKDIVDQWLKTLKIARFDAGNLYLEAKDTFQIHWFEEHIRPLLNQGFFNNNQRPIKVHLALASAEKKDTVRKREETPSFSIEPDPLDPNFRLDHFLPLPQNLMAYKLISELSQTPFNPVYLYGPKKSGKTHLLMGAADLLQKKGKRVFFVRAETFTEHVVQAIRLGNMREFRRIYRDIDVLIVDGIHIFSKKNATQEEFFHTFNTLHTLGRIILLSADAAPSSLKEIEPRLISRFEWGISVGLEKPDFRPILEKKAALWQFPLSPDILAYLLDHFPSDPILALQALAFRSKGSIPNLEIAKRLLNDLLEKEEKNTFTPEKIIKSLAAHFGIRSEDLLGKSQTREFAVPRQIAMYLCRERLKLPYQKIGELFGRDHSTVMSSVKLIQKAADEKKPEILEALKLDR